MRYHITTNDLNTVTLDLPVEDTVTWQDFVNLSQVRALALPVIDVTPDGMPDWFTDEEKMTRQLTNMGIKRTKNSDGVSEYADLDSDNLDS